MSTNSCYGDTKEDEQFWCTATIELSHQEVGLLHSTPCRPPAATPTVTNSNDNSGSEFIDMILSNNDDIDMILNQS